MAVPADLPPRIAKLVRIDAHSGCWIYQGARNPKTGYCQITFKWNGKKPLIHRVVYQLLVGPIPEGLQIDHVKKRGCISRACCNPAHLEPVTARENTMRAGGFIVQNVTKTHCPQGHEYTQENIRWYRGSRACRACELARSRRRYNWQGGLPMGERTHCIRGHPFDADNTYIGRNGRRTCKICARSSVRKYQERKAAERSNSAPQGD